jgi:hypothetical protein
MSDIISVVPPAEVPFTVVPDSWLHPSKTDIWDFCVFPPNPRKRSVPPPLEPDPESDSLVVVDPELDSVPDPALPPDPDPELPPPPVQPARAATTPTPAVFSTLRLFRMSVFDIGMPLFYRLP